MLLLVFKGGGVGVGFLRSAGRTQSQLPASSHPSWRQDVLLQDKLEMLQVLYTYRMSRFPWGGFSDPGHFLLWGRVGGGDTQNTT